MCEQRIVNCIDKENVIDALIFAHKNNAVQLRNACMFFVTFSFEKFSLKKKFKHIPQELVQMITDMNESRKNENRDSKLAKKYLKSLQQAYEQEKVDFLI